MRKFRLFSVLACAALIGSLAAGCSDSDSEENQNPPPSPVGPTGQPTVAIGDNCTAALDAVTFEVAMADGDKAAWTIREKTAEAPTAAQVLSEGAVLEGASPWTVTASGLKAQTVYTIYAAASKGEAVSKLASKEVATLGFDELVTLTDKGKNFVSYHIEVPEGTAYKHLVISKSGLDAFSQFVGEKGAVSQLLQIYGWDATGAADHTARDLDLKANGQPNDIIAGVDHVILCCLTDVQGVPNGDYQVVDLRLPDPEILSKTIRIEIVEAKVDGAITRCTPDDGIHYIFEYVFFKSEIDALLAQGGEAAVKAQLLTKYSSRKFEFTEPDEWISLEADTEYVFYAFGVSEEGDHTPLVRKDFTTLPPPEVVTENIAFNRAFQGIYYGASGAGHNFYFILSDQPMTPDEYGGFNPDAFPCNAINCDLYTAAPAAEAPVLPDGTYAFGENTEPGTWHPDYTWAMNYSETEYETEFYFASGTITVAHQGGDNYRIDLALVSEEGKNYTGSYTGPIFFEDRSAAPASRPFRKLLRSGLR